MVTFLVETSIGKVAYGQISKTKGQMSQLYGSMLPHMIGQMTIDASSLQDITYFTKPLTHYH